MTPWLAHAYTGLGAAVALAATLDVIQGDYRGAFLWLGLQLIIDATDGLLARALRVKELLPDFDGARLDDIIDYLTYVFIPVLLLIHAGVLPQRASLWVGSLVLMASAYGFSQTAAKVETTDHFFTGFPSVLESHRALHVRAAPAPVIQRHYPGRLRTACFRATALCLSLANADTQRGHQRSWRCLGCAARLDHLAPAGD